MSAELMDAELKRMGHPMLAALLTASLGTPVRAETPPMETAQTRQEARLSDELELIKEEETVSIASRYEQPVSQAPSNVYVITDEDIRQSGATDLPTVLRRIPGIEVMQMSGADFNVSARGDNQVFANRMLVLVDGRSIYVDVQGVIFWKAIPVTLPEIKRIEVLKGPASSIYGFNAFDGVINIITKSPEEMKGTTLQFGGGELGTISSAAIHAGKVDKFGYRLSIGHDQNQQWRDRDALAFRSNKFNVQTEYALPRDSKLAVSGGLIDVNRFDGEIGSVVSLSNPFKQAYANAVYERRNFFARLWWSQWDSHADFNTNPGLVSPGGIPFIQLTDAHGKSKDIGFLGNSYNAEAQHTVELGSAYRFTYGVNYRLNTYSSTSLLGYSHENRFGFYAQNDWDIAPTITVTAGARYDLDTFINPTISPRAAILYKPAPDHTFHVALSVGYRPPTIFQSRVDQEMITTIPPFPPQTTLSQGNPNLQPEQIISYEAGYQGWFIKHRLRLRADLFFNHLSDLIFNVNESGSADIYGGEAGAEYLFASWLSGFANFSYQEIGQNFTGENQRGAPRFKYNFGLRGDWANGLNAEAALFHVGSATYPVSPAFTAIAAIPGTGVIVPSDRVGSYNLLNLRGAYKFWKQKAAAGYLREAEVAVSAFNALNDKHKEHPLGDTIGSRVMGWLTVRF
jgi:iron complex outermembrane receptor protein